MTEAIHLYIGGKQVIARRQSGYPWRRRTEPLGAWDWDAAAPSSLTFDQLALPTKRRVNLHVYVGSALSRFMALALPAGLRDLGEQRAAAQAQMQQQLGLNPADWNFTLDPQRPPAKSVVCAVRRNVIERIEALSTQHGLRLMSLQPYVAGVWNAFQERKNAPESALIAIEEDAFTVFVASAGALESMSTLYHRRESGLVEREIKRLGMSAGGVEQEIGVALSNGLAGMAQTNPDRILLKAAYLKEAIYADFRDLLFASEAPLQ